MPRPYGGAIAIGAMFVVVGLAVWLLIPQLIARQLRAPADPRLICAMVGLALVAIGGCAFAWVAHDASRRRTFRHAAREVLPEVPRAPVLIDGTIFHGALRHHLVRHGDEWRVAPDPACPRRERRFVLWFSVPFVVLTEAALWFTSAEGDRVRWFFMAGVLVVMPITVLLFAWMMSMMERQLPTLVLPEHGGDLLFLRRGQTPATLALARRLGSGEPPAAMREEARAIPRAAVCAVQLCACHAVVGARTRRGVYEGVELNLAWRGEGGAIERLTICTVGLAAPLAHLAAALAERLDVPLLHHATAEDWAEERERARHRPPLSSGGFSS